MSTVRLYYGRNNDEMVSRLKEALEAEREVSTVEVRETVLDEAVIEAIVDLLTERAIDTVQLDDCGAYLNKQAIRMARVLGKVQNVRLSEPTFLTQYFLDSLLVGATGLQSLRIQDHLDCSQIQALGTGLKANTSLRTLDLSRSRLDSFSILADGLKNNMHLQHLKIRSLGLRDEHVSQILSAVSQHPSLTSIDLSFNHCQNSDYFARFVNSNRSIQELCLGYQNVWQGPKFEIYELTEALASNTTLSTLSLSRNKLTDQDAIILAGALQGNTTLETLDVKENKIGDDGAVALAQLSAQCHSSGLQKINLMKNLCGLEGENAWLRAVHENVNIVDVQLSSTRSSSSPAILEQIRYYTALNMGGRRFLYKPPPLALWPTILQRADLLEWEDNTEDFFAEDRNATFKLDVLQHLLRGPALFEGIVCRLR